MTVTLTPVPATATPYQSPTPSFTITPTFTISNTPLPTGTPVAPAVLDRNIWRPALGQPLRIGIKPPQAGRVLVRVFNVAGELVREPFESDLLPGVTVEAYWDGQNRNGEPCGAGVYVVSVQGAGISALRKVVLIR